MTFEKMHLIHEEIFSKHPFTRIHIHQNPDKVQAVKLCLFIFTSSVHCKVAMEACEKTVEKIKAELPISGKVIFEDETHR